MRGRPKKYASDEERKAAHAAAKQEKRKQQKEAKERRRLARTPKFEPTGALALRIQLHKAIDANQPKEVIAELYDQVGRAEEIEAREQEMREYDEQLARQEARERKIKLDAMNRGVYMTDAPQGKGLIIVGLPYKEIGTGRVAPVGFGSRQWEDAKRTTHHDIDQEMLDFVNRHFRWTSVLKCYRRGCRYLVVGILPQDLDKPALAARYHCYLHTPIREFRGR